MELFGVCLTLPGAFAASAIYSFLLSRMQAKWPRLTRFLLAVSVVVLIGLALEIALLAVFGAIRIREVVGPGFYVAHLAIFMLGVPSLATALVVGGRHRWFGRWYIAAAMCAVFAVGLVLLQYSVAEALYGINGTEGPFG